MKAKHELEFVTFKDIELNAKVARRILVIDGVPYYKSSGINSGMANTYFPFLGIELYGQKSNWFRKPGFISGLREILNPLTELFNEFKPKLFDKELEGIRDRLQRFTSVKCLLISYALSKGLEQDDESIFDPENKSYWSTDEGMELSAFLIKKYPDFCEKTQYIFKDSGLVFDVSYTAKQSRERKEILSSLNVYIEKQLNIPLNLHFNPKDFEDNLRSFDWKIKKDSSFLFFRTPLTKKIPTPLIKKVKNWLKDFDQEVPKPQRVINFKPTDPQKTLQLIWPLNLDVLGIDVLQRQEMEQIIRFSYGVTLEKLPDAQRNFLDKGYSAFYFENKGDFENPKFSPHKHTCYFKFFILYNGQIIVEPNKEVLIYEDKSKDLKVYKVYNLSTGEWMVLKTAAPKRAFNELCYLSGKEGITTICGYVLQTIQKVITIEEYNGFYKTSYTEAKSFNKLSVIEKLYPKTFLELVSSRQSTPKDIARYMLSLFKGLSSIHSVQCLIPFKDTWMPISAFHGDIKPENIMYDKDTNTLVFIDFDRFANWTIISYSNSYLSPELAHALQTSNPNCFKEEDNVQFNARYGQACDLWNLALVLSILLSKPTTTNNYKESCIFPPFYFIHNRLNIPNQNSRYWRDLSSLKQKEIDQELEGILSSLPDNKDGQIYFVLWSIVVAMLKVDPDKRMPALVSANILQKMLDTDFDLNRVHESSNKENFSLNLYQ